MSRGLIGVAVLLSVVLVGCGQPGPTKAGGGTPASGDEPLTARALAAVVAEYAGPPATARDSLNAEEVSEESGEQVAAAVAMEYTGDPEGKVYVGVGTGLKDFPQTCADVMTEDGNADGCEEVQDGVLFWQDEEPEEDPGVIVLAMSMSGTEVAFYQSGPSVTDDPRNLDLPVSVQEMMAIAGDPRVDVTTSKDAITAGENLTFWQESDQPPGPTVTSGADG